MTLDRAYARTMAHHLGCGRHFGSKSDFDNAFHDDEQLEKSASAQGTDTASLKLGIRTFEDAELDDVIGNRLATLIGVGVIKHSISTFA